MKSLNFLFFLLALSHGPALPSDCAQPHPQGHTEGTGTFLGLFTCPGTLEQTLGLPQETRKLLEKFGLPEREAAQVSWAMEIVVEGLTQEGLNLKKGLDLLEDADGVLLQHLDKNVQELTHTQLAEAINELIGIALLHGNNRGIVLGGLTAVGHGPFRKLKSSIVFDSEELTHEKRRQLTQLGLSLDFPQTSWALRNAILSRLNLREGEFFHSYARFSNEQRKLLALGLMYRSLIADSWFCCKRTLEFIDQSGKKFIFGIKSNRIVYKTKEDRKKGNRAKLSEVDLEEGHIVPVYLNSLDFQVYVMKRIFTNKNGTQGTLYLVTNDADSTAEDLYNTYQRRWKIEEYHKSLKNNVGIGKSPTKIERTQSCHIFASIYAYAKLELLKLKTEMNHFALKRKIHVASLKAAREEIERLRDMINAA